MLLVSEGKPRAYMGGTDTLSGIKGINSNPRSWQAWLHGQK